MTNPNKSPNKRGSRKTSLTHLEKALMGGGAIRRIQKPVEGSIKGRWKMP